MSIRTRYGPMVYSKRMTLNLSLFAVVPNLRIQRGAEPLDHS